MKIPLLQFGPWPPVLSLYISGSSLDLSGIILPLSLFFFQTIVHVIYSRLLFWSLFSELTLFLYWKAKTGHKTLGDTPWVCKTGGNSHFPKLAGYAFSNAAC